MAETLPERDIGILVHGRHMQTDDINRLLWGFDDVERQMGTVPTTILTMLNAGPEKIKAMYIGSGSSLSWGMQFESYDIFDRFWKRFDEFEDFKPISDHPKANTDSWFWISMALNDAVTDIRAKSTREEIAEAAALFTDRGVRRVYQVTNSSHGARCLEYQNLAREQDIIPADQQWFTATDDQRYLADINEGPAVVETPHRDDDPFLNQPRETWPVTLT